MDDDDRDDSGIGALAAYQLGRWSAEGDQSRRALVARLTGRQPVSRDLYDYAVEMNQRLVAEDRRLNNLVTALQTEVNNSRADHERLRVWADERETEVEDLRAKYAALVELDKEKNLLLADLSNDLEEMQQRFGPLPPRLS